MWGRKREPGTKCSVHVLDITMFIPPITVRMMRNDIFAEDDLLHENAI